MLLEKRDTFKNDIIIIDGLWGTGKSLLAPIVSGMDRIEKVKIEHIYEYVCVMAHLNKITPDAVDWMLKTYSDLSQYNNVIGREINLRYSDDSGFSNNPNSVKYIARLFAKEGDHNIDYINNENIGLQIMSHMLMLVSEPIFEAFGERAHIIEVVRHPLYMVNHWLAYLERFESPREFTVSFDYEGEKMPWFVSGWEHEYFHSNSMDRVLLCIICVYNWLFNATEDAINNGKRVLTLSFEGLVMDPEPPLNDLKLFLNREHYSRIKSILNKQKIPRKTLSQGKGHAAYGWSKSDITKNEEDIYKQLFEKISAEGSEEVVDNFQDLIKTYNSKYPSVLSEFQ